MAGAYCQFCDHRCFVERWVPGHGTLHMATCATGAAHDRTSTGYDHTTAVNRHDPAVAAYADAVAAHHRQDQGERIAASIRHVAADTSDYRRPLRPDAQHGTDHAADFEWAAMIAEGTWTT